jgi:hypothetical protein
MKKLLTIILFLLTALTSSAQENFFEGELVYDNFENHSKMVLKFSKGMAYNGKRTVRVLMKGSVIHMIDNVLHFHTLLFPDENKAIIFSDFLKRGQQFPYDEYVKTYLSQFSISKGSVKGTFEKTGETEMVRDRSCHIMKGKVSVSGVKTDLEAWVSQEYKIYDSYRTFTFGMDIDGIAMKCAYKTVGKIPLLGEARSYVQSELVEMKTREVTDEELSVPEGYKIVESSSPFKVVGLYNDTRKYMKAQGIYPDDIDKEVTFKTEDEWSF